MYVGTDIRIYVGVGVLKWHCNNNELYEVLCNTVKEGRKHLNLSKTATPLAVQTPKYQTRRFAFSLILFYLQSL